jgi:hypothetical protein
MITQEVPIFPKDLMTMLRIKDSKTLSDMIKRKRLPAPDVRLTAKTRYWHRATLVNAGLLLAEKASPPNPAASSDAQ